MKTSRNEPCPCGSGKKYKNCHDGQTPERASTNRIGWIVTAVVAAGAISLFASLRGGSNDRTTSQTRVAPLAPAASTAPATANTAPPSGDPPPGKVWSTEHGHWHDVADASQIQLSTDKIPITAGDLGANPQTDPNATPGASQPPGPAPAGKVWSVEHGHWHDAPGTATVDRTVPAELQPYMKPPGVPAAPAGAVWSEEHKHWHNAEEEAKRKGTVNPSTAAPQAKPDNR
jgi:hypothetical protein